MIYTKNITFIINAGYHPITNAYIPSVGIPHKLLRPPLMLSELIPLTTLILMTLILQQMWSVDGSTTISPIGI